MGQREDRLCSFGVSFTERKDVLQSGHAVYIRSSQCREGHNGSSEYRILNMEEVVCFIKND